MIEAGNAERPVCDTCGLPLNVLGFCAACDAGGPPVPLTGAAGAKPTQPDNDTGAGAQPIPAAVQGVAVRQEAQASVPVDDDFGNKLRRYQTANTPATVFIGFRAAGKTWLLRRYVNWLNEFVDFVTPMSRTDDDDDEGTSVPGSTSFEFYDVIPPDSRYCLIDTPGEYTQRLAQGQIVGISQLVAALDYASALIVALPADVVLFGPAIRRLSKQEIEMLIERAFAGHGATPDSLRLLREWVKNIRFDAGLVQRFADGLGLAAGTLSYVRRHQIDCLDATAVARIKLEDVIDHLGTRGAFTPVGGVTGLACPAFFALTKSDRVIAALFGPAKFQGAASELNDLKDALLEMPQTRFLHELAKYRCFTDKSKYPLQQPADFVRKVDPLLYSRLTRFFPMGRFDFVTAFFGHDYSDRLGADHYVAHPAHGVDHMHDWLRDARQLASRGDRRMSHHNLARQVYRFTNAVPSGNGNLFGQS